MLGRLIVLVTFSLLISCSEENLPPKLYAYQVERLLSGGSSKLWIQEVNSQNCEDSLKILITASNDSIDIYKIPSGANCFFQDTLFVGRADASQTLGSILFTDSLIFRDGEHWTIKNLTSDRLELDAEGTVESYFRQEN